MSIKLLFGFALLVLPARPLFAQAAPEESTPPQLTIYSRTVVEDVVVMDKGGKAVPGLRKEDFQVLENGKSQAITFFETNFGAAEAAPPSLIPTPDTFTNIRLADPGGVTNVLLLDAVNTWPEDEMYAHVQMVKFLASLPPHLRIGILTLTPEKLNLVWPLNQDSSVLRDAVVRFSSSHSASPTTSAQQQALLSVLTETQKTAQEAQDSQLAESAYALRKFLKRGVGVIQQHNHGAGGALEASAHYLAGIPGRKNLFWIVGNFPHCVPENACSETIYALGEAGVSLYPIDAWGVDVNMGLGPDPLGHQAANRFIDSEYWAEATGGKALAIKADAADTEAVRLAVAKTIGTFGGIDILVNNAGTGIFAPIEQFSLEDFEKLIAINVRGLFVATQEAARHLREGGRIIHIGSTNSERMPFVGGSVYALTKGAVAGFTKGLARDLGVRGITVNNVQPGPIDTDMNPADSDFAKTLVPITALQRYGNTDEIASFVAYLASPEASYITGASLLADGGFAA